jgi:hypothetical protein
MMGRSNTLLDRLDPHEVRPCFGIRITQIRIPPSSSAQLNPLKEFDRIQNHDKSENLFFHSTNHIIFHVMPFYELPFHDLPLYDLPFQDLSFYDLPFHDLPF